MKNVFKDFKKVKYEGPESDNPMAFKYYNPEEKIAGKKMESNCSGELQICLPIPAL